MIHVLEMHQEHVPLMNLTYNSNIPKLDFHDPKLLLHPREQLVVSCNN